MQQYLYIYNYSQSEQELCHMEFRRIFHSEMTSKYWVTSQDFDYTRSAYIRGRLTILCASLHFEDIFTFLRQKPLCFEGFKVIYLKNECTHIPYQETLDKCRQIALPIQGSVNMHSPQVVLALTCIHHMWYFGIYENKMIWRRHSDKPHSYSHSLALKDARTLVNIALGDHVSRRLVDPCCGIGTVVLEGLSMNADIHGYEINRYVAYQARLNLEYYGYDPLIIQRRDMKTLQQTYDVVIMDIPYGIYSPFTYHQQMELLEKSVSLAPELVLVSHRSMKTELRQLGYRLIDEAMIQKGGFQRYIVYAVLSNREEESS